MSSTVASARRRKPKPPKRRKFKTIVIKLSANQSKSLMNYCRARKTTPNKLIKKNIARYLHNFGKEVPAEYYVSERQLDLFGDTIIQ